MKVILKSVKLPLTNIAESTVHIKDCSNMNMIWKRDLRT